MAEGEGRGHAAILILNFLLGSCPLPNNLHANHDASDRRRQPSVPRAKLLRVRESLAVARPSDRDALRNMV